MPPTCRRAKAGPGQAERIQDCCHHPRGGDRPGAGGAVGTLYRHFDNARSQMTLALDRLLAAGAAAGTIRGGVHGRTVLRALGGICGMHATEGWRDYAVRITALLFDGLRHGAEVAAQQAMAFGYLSSASV
ncbi:SbtR family transcriptional regulator [Streptomyces mirabilis]